MIIAYLPCEVNILFYDKRKKIFPYFVRVVEMRVSRDDYVLVAMLQAGSSIGKVKYYKFI